MRAFEWAEPEINTYTLVLSSKHVQRKPMEFNPYNFYVALFSQKLFPAVKIFIPTIVSVAGTEPDNLKTP